jgi:hypothetical protein
MLSLACCVQLLRCNYQARLGHPSPVCPGDPVTAIHSCRMLTLLSCRGGYHRRGVEVKKHVWEPARPPLEATDSHDSGTGGLSLRTASHRLSMNCIILLGIAPEGRAFFPVLTMG